MPAPSGVLGQFYYRRNKDNSFDAICLSCFLTAANADSVEKLHELEAAHRCPSQTSSSNISDAPVVPHVA